MFDSGLVVLFWFVFFFFKQKTAYEILNVTGVQTCALPISPVSANRRSRRSIWWRWRRTRNFPIYVVEVVQSSRFARRSRSRIESVESDSIFWRFVRGRSRDGRM